MPLSVIVTPPQSTLQAGQTVQLSATDADGGPLPTSGVSWTSSDSRVAAVSAGGLVSGVAVGGPVTITAAVGTTTGSSVVTVTSGPPSQLTIETQPSAAGLSGSALSQQPVVQLRDADGNEARAAGVLVTAVLEEGQGTPANATSGQGTLANATATTDTFGRAVFSGLTISGAAGVYRLRFESTDLTAGTSDAITLTIVAAIALVAQPSTTAQSGSALVTQPRISVRDAGDSPVIGEPVTATIASGGATLLGTTTVLTDGSGVATFSDLILTGSVGDYTLSFTAGSVSTESGTITLGAGPPTSVVVLTQPSPNAQSGAVFSQQPSVEVRDDVGNLVTGVDVDVSIASGGGTLGGGTTVATDGAGRATFSDLSITGAPGARTLQFQAGTASVVSESISLTSGVPALMAIVTQPSSSAQNGVSFGQQPVVEVRDAGGNPIGGFNVTAAVSSGGGTLGGTTTVLTNGSGVATFTDLNLTGLVGDRTLSFTAGSASIESGTIVLDVGPPASVVVLTEPSSTAQSGVVLGQQPSVEVRDAGGNLLGGVDVDASIASGGGVLGGSTTVATDGAGQATFGDVSITGVQGLRTLRFQAGSTSVVSGSISLTAGPPALVTIVTQPSSSAQSGVQLGQQPAVDVRDAGGNPAAGSIVTASIATGGGTLGGTTTAAVGANGIATFSGLSISGLVGQRTLRFTAGAAGATSASITLEVGPLAGLVVTLQPSSSAANAVPFARQPTVRAEDDAGNPIAGLAITVAIGVGGGTLGGTRTVTTSGAGVAAFTNLAITGTIGIRTLRFTTGGMGVTSNAINIGPGAPTSVAIMTQPPSFTFTGTTFTQFPSVEVQDISGNAVPGQDVVATIASGLGALGGTTTVNTNGTGSATFANLSITGAPGAHTLRFSSNGAQATSTPVSVTFGQGTYLDVTYCGTQKMDVYVPSNALSRPLPVAVYIHGGGWTSGDKSNVSNLMWTEVRDELLLSSRGYVVVSLNYRLATAGSNKWPAQIHDVKCAIRHLRAQAGDYGFDGVRIGVWGASAGGHLTSMLGVTDASSGFEGSEGFAGWSSSVKAAVPIAGISDLTGGPSHPELNFSGPSDTFNTWPGPSAQLTSASPITWASSGDPPFLIVHGDQDTTVFPAQATRLFGALGGSSPDALQIVTNGGHKLDDVGMGTPSPTILQIAQQIADFLDTHVRFNP